MDQERATFLPKGEAAVKLPPDRTVLLVIDPVNDFLSEGGAGWEMTKSTVKMNDVVKHIKQAIEGARSRRIPVLFGPRLPQSGSSTVPCRRPRVKCGTAMAREGCGSGGEGDTPA